MEQIYSDIAAAGLRGGLTVVPEFKLPYQVGGKKHADFVWIATQGDPELPPRAPRVVAAFEVEGFDVPLTNIVGGGNGMGHLEKYALIREVLGVEFRCYVPLYSLATHRPAWGSIDLQTVRKNVAERQAVAAGHEAIVQVCDAERRGWLAEALDEARRLSECQIL